MHLYQIRDYLFDNIILAPVYYFAAVLIGLIALLVCKKASKNTKKAVVIGTIASYLFLVLASTVLIRTQKETYTFELQVFWSYIEISQRNIRVLLEIVINVFMLMPVGVLLAIGFDMRKKHVVITGVMISLTIEVLQLVTRRGLFEFDDILHNGIGCLIGYVICRWGVERKSLIDKKST